MGMDGRCVERGVDVASVAAIAAESAHTDDELALDRSIVGAQAPGTAAAAADGLQCNTARRTAGGIHRQVLPVENNLVCRPPLEKKNTRHNTRTECASRMP